MPYLPQTLASIEAQGFRDYQVLLWDNGSTDGTVEEARRWIPSRLTGVLRVGSPLPLGHALAAMVRECDTEFCARLDADDVSHPDRLEKQIAFLLAHPEIAVVGTQMRTMNAEGQLQGSMDYPLDHEQVVVEMLRRNALAHPTVMFRRSAVLAAGNYRDFSPVHVEDYDLWLRLALMNLRLANLPDALVDYRIHAASSTQKSIAAHRLDTEMLRRLAESAPQLFGCSGETMTRLKNRMHPLAVLPLLKIARHLRISTGESPWDSPVFCRACSEMIGRNDLISRSWIRLNRARIGYLGISD